ncbi:hypothetical protein C8Q74DRAFT_1187428, partial [Fomes fomentarius]
GDAIVWWRAWVVWKSNRMVQTVCILWILGAAVVQLHDPSNGLNTPLPLGALYTGDKWGLAASIISLLTNVTATGLIAYKAWTHRRFIGSHLQMGSTRTRAEKVLALLVESGIAYCFLWVCLVSLLSGAIPQSFLQMFMVIYQSLTTYNVNTHSDKDSQFTLGFHYVVDGCLISLIVCRSRLMMETSD